MDNNDRKITVIDENGVERDYLILFTYHSDDFDKDYVVFYDENNIEELFACRYFEEDKRLENIETDEEYDELEKVIEKNQKTQEN